MKAAPEAAEGGSGSKYGPWAHVLFSAALFVGTLVLVSTAHGDKLEKGLDFVRLYSYSKASADRTKTLDSISEYVKQNSWTNDVTDAKHCLDVSYFKFPRVSFFPENDPTSPTCQISFNVASGPVDGQIRIAGVLADTSATSNCAPGNYPLRVTGGSGSVPLTPYLTILEKSKVASNNVSVITVAPPANATLVLSSTGSIAYDYKYYTTDFGACRKLRQDLADKIHAATSCQHAGSSPLCQCVRAFTDPITSWTGKLKAKYSEKFMLEDVLVKGIGRCIDLRRAHDVRKALPNPYARTSALFLFAVALLFNSVLSVFAAYGQGWSSSWSLGLQALWLALYWAGSFFSGLLDADGGVADFSVPLAVTLPAFIVHGGYELLLKYHQSYRGEPGRAAPEPYLHPVTFDLCLCALTLFTLVERGVVQQEYLVVEVFKCHAVAAIYIGVSWFHKYGQQAHAAGDGRLMSSEAVQQAYLALVLLGLAASCAPMVVPYPAKKCFEFHWLLPGAFAYLALANPSWAHSLQVMTKLNTGDSIRGYNEVAGVFALFFGAILWGYFLQDHIQVFGSAHFPYPSVRDPLAPVTMRVL